MQPPNEPSFGSSPVPTAQPAKHPHRGWLRGILRFLAPLRHLPVIGGLGRTTWLILSVASLAAIVAGSFLAPTSSIEQPLPKRFSQDWWIRSLEFHRELQLASFGDDEIESIAVVRKTPNQDRILVAGQNALLAFSDDQGRTWTRVLYDSRMGGFAVAGKRAPFPDTSGPSTPAPQGNTAPASGSAAGKQPGTKSSSGTTTPGKEGTPYIRTAPPPLQLQRQQKSTNPAQQSQPQQQKQQNAPPAGSKPASKPSAKSAALRFFPSILPVVLASEKSRSAQGAQNAQIPETTTTSDSLAARASLAPATLAPQPPPQNIIAICSQADSLVLVMGSDRAAVSSDFGETWAARSLNSLRSDPAGFRVADVLAGRVTWLTPRPHRLVFSLAVSPGSIGDTNFSSTTGFLEPKDGFIPPSYGYGTVIGYSSAFLFPDLTVWAARALRPKNSTLSEPSTGFLDRLNPGQTKWSEAFRTPGVALRDVAFSADGSTGYLVGDKGGIWRWRKSDPRWLPVSRGALNPAQASSANQANETYWKLPPPWTYIVLVLAFGWLVIAILISAVPGANTLAEAGDWLTTEKPAESGDGGVALISVSDRPLGEDDVDRLGFRGIARGVAGFLRNPKTQLPVTLAINGQWGTGKSSLMNLISGELKRAGFRPVWFNAWHHQEDENLLASLLQSVRSDASPPLIRKGGLAFRFRLGWFRFVRFYPRALAMAAIFIGLWAGEYWLEQPQNGVNIKRYFAEELHVGLWAKSAETSQGTAPAAQNAPSGPAGQPGGTPTAAPTTSGTGTKSAGTDSPDSQSWLTAVLNFLGMVHEKSDGLTTTFKLPKPLAALYLLLQVFPAAFEKLKAFTANPAALLHSVAPGVSEKEIEAQTSFRMRFAREFADVTRALGDRHRLVIFVDDLDRCRPGNVAEMMEAINYVSVAGECAFVLGIETQAVRAALGLSFDAIAQEIDPQAIPVPAGSPVVALAPDSAEAKRANRKDFACRYIEKLINIEMNVPQLDVQKKQALFATDPPAPPARDPYERAQKIARMGRLLEPAAMFILALALGWGVGSLAVRLVELQAKDHFQDQLEDQNGGTTIPPATNSAANATQPAAGNTPSQPATAVANVTSNVAQVLTQIDAAAAPEVQSGEQPLPAAMLQTPLSWIVIAGLVTLLIQLLAREPIPPAKDSQEFTRALAAWSWIAGDALATPRAAKRFLNRLRFLAMRQHPPAVQLPGVMRLLLTPDQQQRALQQEEARAAGGAPQKPIPENVLVALASLEAYPKGTPDNKLSVPALGPILDNLSQFVSSQVARGDFRSAPFLVELSRLASSFAPTFLPEFTDDKARDDYFRSLAAAGQLPALAKSWGASASAAMQPYLDQYSGLGGDVEFT